MSKLNEHKKLYKFLNEARKRCKTMANAYVENFVRLQHAHAEKERLINLMIEEQQRRNTFFSKVKNIIGKADDNTPLEQYRTMVESCDATIEELTKANYEYGKQVHDDIATMDAVTSRLMEKHDLLQKQVEQYIHVKADTWVKEMHLNQHFPRYSETMRKCEAVLMFLKEYIVKRMDIDDAKSLRSSASNAPMTVRRRHHLGV